MNTLEILGTLSLAYLAVGAVTATLSDTGPDEEEDWLGRVTLTYVLVVAWPVVWAAGISSGVREIFKGTNSHQNDSP